MVLQWEEPTFAPDGDCILNNCCCFCLGAMRDANEVGENGALWAAVIYLGSGIGCSCIVDPMFKDKLGAKMGLETSISAKDRACACCCGPCYLQSISRTVKNWKEQGGSKDAGEAAPPQMEMQ